MNISEALSALVSIGAMAIRPSSPAGRLRGLVAAAGCAWRSGRGVPAAPPSERGGETPLLSC